MTTAETSQNAPMPEIGFPGKKEIEKWVGDAVSPLLKPLSRALDGVKNDVLTVKRDAGSIIGDTGKLVENLLKPLSADVEKYLKDAEAMVGHLPDFSYSVDTLEKLSKSALQYDAEKGAAIKAELIKFSQSLKPVLTDIFKLLGITTKPLILLDDVEKLCADVDDSLFGPLFVITDYIDIDEITKELSAIPAALEQKLNPDVDKHDLMASGELGLTIGVAYLRLFVSILDYLIGSFPLGLSGKLGAGGALGVIAFAGGSLRVVSLTELVLGPFKGLMALTADVLLSVQVEITGPEDSDIKSKIDAVKKQQEQDTQSILAAIKALQK